MDANLVGAASFQPTFHQSGPAVVILHHPQPRYRMTARAVPDHGLTLPVGLVAGKFGGNSQDAARLHPNAPQAAQPWVTGIRFAMHHGQVAAGHRVILELPGQPMMRPVGFGDNQEASGVLVDPVDDAGPTLAANSRQRIAAMKEQCVDQRATRCTGRRVHHHPRRLVDHDQVAILPDHLERNILRQSRHIIGRVKLDAVDLARCQLGLDVGHRHAIPADSAFRDHPGQPAARQSRIRWHKPGKRLIKAGRRIKRDGDIDRILFRIAGVTIWGTQRDHDRTSKG